MDSSIVDSGNTSRKRKRDEKKELEKKIIVAAAGVVCMLMGAVAWYYNEYFVEEPADNSELDLEDASATIHLEESSSSAKRKGQSSTSTGTLSQRRKIREKDEIVASMKKVAESLKKLSQIINNKPSKKDIQEVLHEVGLIPNLDKQQWATAVHWLTALEL